LETAHDRPIHRQQRRGAGFRGAAIAKYEVLLSHVPEDATAYLSREPNGSALLRRIDNIRQGRNLVEQELLPDED
jgi:hypothetical protein